MSLARSISPLAVSDDDAAGIAELERYHLVRLFAGQDDDGIRAVDAAGCGARGFFQRAAVIHIGLYEMRYALRVGLGIEDVSLARQFMLQVEIVLEDAVVHDHHIA